MLVALARARRFALSGQGRTIRVATGISLREMARELQVAPGVLSRWERGICKPRGDAALRWEVLLLELATKVAAA